MSASQASQRRPARVAIVGSGPSGFYTAAALLKQDRRPIEVDLYDRLPTPYGLVRGGVAPDHQNIKGVIRVYDKLARRDALRFFGNVVVGRDVTIEELARHYDQIVIAAGNEGHRRMGIPGEDLSGVFSATEFVGWYNGHPDYAARSFPLETATRVAVVGNGNVAMDVTRVLAKRAERLASTDIASYALDALARSAAREVHVLGRRGPAEAAFTNKEVKEIGSLEDADLIVEPRDAELDDESARWIAEHGTPGAKRNVEYLLEKSRETPRGRERRVQFRFMISPIEFLGDHGTLDSVRLERNELFLDERGTPRPRGTGETWIEPFQMAFTAVGYRGLPIPGCPFDERAGIVPNVGGRLRGEDGAALPGLYAVGWAKRGPTGLIGDNVADAEETARHMLEDLDRDLVTPGSPDRDAAHDGGERAAIERLLETRGVRWVTFEDWTRLDALEIERGCELGKIREKFSSVERMLDAIEKARGAARATD
ncbi:MAG TPA: FAD-dependent oxidoreductase [Thermoanaerobaculia bacterium]|nr:FAD-dependent oxidoreductase [Thermoanaerobaculia bacterium]